MRWGKLLFIFGILASCNLEYGINKNTTPAGPLGDTGLELETVPPQLADVPEPGEQTYAQIHIDPYDYDFGEVDVNCEYEYDVVVSSVGTEALVIDEITYDSTPELEMVTEYKLPIVLEPGESMSFTFEFDEVDLIPDFGRMFIYSNALGKKEQMVTNMGVGTPTGWKLDTFEQEEINKADILFVIDNSCSMSEEQTGLAANASDFVDKLLSLGVDFQISVITTDSATPIGDLITPTTADPVGEFATAVQAGTSGNMYEQGQEYAMQALDLGPLSSSRYGREDAALSVVVVSDEDDFSPLTELEYNDFFYSIKHPDLFFFHSIVGVGPGCGTATGDRYMDQSMLTDGSILDLCGLWGDNLTTLANANYIIATYYPLTEIAAPGSVEVFLDGNPLKSGWYYDVGTNSVVLEDKSAVVGDEMFQILYDYLGECPE